MERTHNRNVMFWYTSSLYWFKSAKLWHDKLAVPGYSAARVIEDVYWLRRAERARTQAVANFQSLAQGRGYTN